MMTLTTVTALVFVGVAMASYAVLDLTLSDDRRVSRRLKGLTDYERSQVHDAQPLLVPFRSRVIAPLFAGLGGGIRRIWPADYRDAIAKKLERAGHPHGLDATRMLVAKLLVAGGALLLVPIMGMLGAWTPGMTFLATVAATALGFFGPDMWLSSRVSRRQHQIVRELPDMLDLLTISVEAGLGFDAALAKLVKSNRGALAEEFGRALQEIQAGSSRREALRHMAERVDVSELSAFNASIIQADIFGISVAQVLRTQSAEMRLRRRQRAEELAQKAPVKMVIPLTLCILPATLIIVGGPAAMGIMAALG